MTLDWANLDFLFSPGKLERENDALTEIESEFE